jgi:hypothetical protein
MPRTDPLITPEELQCLLSGSPERSEAWGISFWQHVLHVGAALWLIKGIFLYALLMSPEAASLVGSSRYLWMRGSLELVCLAVFWGASLHPRGRQLVSASLLIASTSLLLDAMTLLAVTS